MTTATKKQKDEAPPRRHVSDSPEVQEAKAKLRDMSAHMKAYAIDVERLAKQVLKRGQPDSHAETRQARLEQLQAGDFTPPPPVRTPVKIQLRDKRRELRTLEIAVGRQARAVETAKAHASIKICATVGPEFRGLSQAIVDQWFAIIGAFDAYDLFVANLREEGVSLGSLPSLDLSKEFRTLLGTPRNPTGAFGGMVTSARRHQYTVPDTR